MGNTQSEQQVWAESTKLVWTEEAKKGMRDSILEKMSDTDQNLKILLFGEVASGKSSLTNGFITAMDNEREFISTFFPVAKSGETVTKGGAEIGKFWLIDMEGIYDSTRINEKAIRDIVSGKVPLYARLTEHLEIEDRKQLGIPSAEKNDIACVVLVIKHGDEMSLHIKRLIDLVIKLAGEGAVAYQVVLTHVDKLDSKFIDKKKLPSVFQSKDVWKAVNNIQQQIGVPVGNISVVRNYFLEHQPDLHCDILFLHALRRIVSSARDQALKIRHQNPSCMP